MKFLFRTEWMLIRKNEVVDRGTKYVTAKDGNEAWKKCYAHKDVPLKAKILSIELMGGIHIY